MMKFPDFSRKLAEITPFHWEIEFPEVFQRENPGFDAFVGNPPFAGRTTLYESTPPGYIDWLQVIHEEAHGNADLVAHFFRRAFDLIRNQGAFGLIATNTIGQGDTRATGLRWICTHGGTIYNATKRLKWPGQAAVVVSVVHIYKGEHEGPFLLDGRTAPAITAFLFHAGGHDSPATLRANAGKSFQGCVVVGMGFTFDDTDSKGVATPIAEMHRLIAENPGNAEVIFPYIGGEEVNTSPTHEHHRYVINFGDRSEDECRRNWPELIRIVEDKVKTERVAALKKWSSDKAKRAEYWWQFSRTAKDLYEAIHGMKRVLVISRVTEHPGFAVLPANEVFSERLVIFPLLFHAQFTLLQTRLHEIWSRFFGSTLEDRLMYAPSDCFETFPFPKDFETNAALESSGRDYYEYRAALMVRNDEGLTKTYNRFHDPEERSPEIVRLRELHAAMDRAVLDAYGWTDLQPACEFLLDYEDEEGDGDDAPTKGRGRKKPWRYRWPDDFRDEVLARLLRLNADRAEEERLSGAAAERRGKQATGRKQTGKRSTTGELF